MNTSYQYVPSIANALFKNGTAKQFGMSKLCKYLHLKSRKGH